MRRVLTNIFSNWTGYFVTVVVGFFLAPFVLHHLGNTGYGVWTLVLSLTGYFGLLDLGIRSSVGRFVARYVALADEGQVNRTVSTAMAILACGSLLALVATWVIEANFGSFKVGPELQTAGRTALCIAGLQIATALPLGVFAAVLMALERYDIITGITIVGAITRAGLIVLCLRSGYGLVAVATVALLVGTGEYVAMGLAARKHYRSLRVGLSWVDRKTAHELFGFGVYRFIWIIANQLIFYTDSLVIGIFLGASEITFYAIAGSVIAYGRNIVSLATDPLYPIATRLDSKKDMAGLRDLQVMGTRISLMVGLPVCLGFVFLGRQFITLWMGAQYGRSAVILAVLTIPQFTSMSQYVSALVLSGMARHKVLAYVALGEGLANLGLSIILVRRIGVIGVAWGTVVPHLINTVIVIPWYTLHALDLDVGEYFRRALLRPLLCAVPVGVACYGFSRTIENVSWFSFGAEVGTIVVIGAVMGFFICLTAEQRDALLARVHGLGREVVPDEV